MSCCAYIHQHFSLFGAGVALTLSFFADLLLAIVFMRRKYHYRLSPTAIKYLSIQLPIGLFTYATFSSKTYYHGFALPHFTR